MKRKIYRIVLIIILFSLLIAACKIATAYSYVVDSESCLACGRCLEACPHNAIVYQGDKAFIIQSKCQQCGQCVAVCPEKAIH
ncbi:MAG: 4Fe-4S binding protein [Candidatus Stygibacter australis]|nr:4Fe-4S binding protein [Candidatus Stygibacter australis]MDP8323121.1 4Fe-4S binding protein [Candidatus Stygibacter australis]